MTVSAFVSLLVAGFTGSALTSVRCWRAHRAAEADLLDVIDTLTAGLRPGATWAELDEADTLAAQWRTARPAPEPSDPPRLDRIVPRSPSAAAASRVDAPFGWNR